MSVLQRPVVDLKGVGEQLAAKLNKLQIKTLQDVLFHLPLKYVDRTRIYPIITVRTDDVVVVEGVIEKVSVIPKPRRNMVVKFRDSTGVADMRLFHFNAMQQQQFVLGKKIRCFGTARQGRSGLQFIHPEYTVFASEQIVPVEEYLTPIYPATEGVGQKILRNLVKQVLTLLKPIAQTLEILPAPLGVSEEHATLFASLEQIHFPTPECYTKVLNQGYHPAQRQLAFEELLAQHLSLRQKRNLQQRDRAHSLKHAGKLNAALLANLPFTLTSAQQRVFAIIADDLQQNFPMLRLVQGDVGSGKTLVALMAALHAIEAGLQVAFMAPTEILAEQHYANIRKLLAPLNIEVCCLSAAVPTKHKNLLQEKIANDQIKLVIGTHALFQNSIQFKNLGLVIIDEQHKFGVAQRLALHKKGSVDDYVAHQLILTATPIPRTLAMTFYADLDYAVIDELPPGRKPITTLVVSDKRRAEEQLPGLKIGLIHARLSSEQKEQIMAEFKAGAINVLVATTVIEVGVDVPNACLMVIENPERLGLAQLHQLRGRVGRGAQQSYCLLLYKAPLGQKAMQRLQVMRDTQDGFALAEYDLQIRGPGEVFGTKQSGIANLRIADLIRDKDLLPKVADTAEKILREHAELIPRLLQRWLREQIEYAVV